MLKDNWLKATSHDDLFDSLWMFLQIRRYFDDQFVRVADLVLCYSNQFVSDGSYKNLGGPTFLRLCF
jgi:hypothetical protein